jgi:hypothetical protein
MNIRLCTGIRRGFSVFTLFGGKKQMHRLEESEYCAKYRDDDSKDGNPETRNNVEIAQYPDDDSNGEQKNCNDDQ